ncbi:polymeric immunoglobulin receptor-like isoform X2 [Chanodichthys erythropterus]|uniref:polymeric immunoglobulin receptor-like isoform X2 n=1 Tax=Chanodichthys erythropterus TaxID=933992 RepID=UPI00351E9B21
MGKVILCILLTVALLISEKLVVVLAHQGDTLLGSSVTLPCQDSKHRDISADLLDIQWWTGEHLVVRFQRGIITQGSRYINRTNLSAEGLRNGDFSLSIPRTEFSDSGRYRCVLTQEGQEVALGEVDLEVKVPRSQSALFVESGQRVILSCFGYGDWSGSEAAFVQWKRWTQVVLQWKSGSLYVDPVFEGRVSVPQDRIIHGDMSLIFNDTHLEDQGYYVCFFKNNDDIRPSTIINLTVTEQMSRVNITSGSQFQLPLPDESPVTLSFLPDGPGPGKVTFDGPLSPLAAAALGGSLLFLVVTSGYACHKQRQLNRIPEHGTEKNREKGAEKGSEMQPLQFIEVITQGSVSSKKSAVI